LKKWTLLFILILMVSTFSACKKEPQEVPEAQEMRGLWVATVLNLDFPSKSGLSRESLCHETDALLDRAQEIGINTIFLQVRPCADSLYPSTLFPWSEVLSGEQGVPPDEGFDVLEYWLSGAHARGIKLHAWINPFRITMNETDVLAQNHPANLHPEWTVRHNDGKLYWNPGVSAARQYIIDGVMEIVNRYPIDGIHFDDYFYPDETFPDGETFAQSGEHNLLNWRRENINTLICNTNAAIKEYDESIEFGVSPFGIWQNDMSSIHGSQTRGLESYTAHAADSRRWVKEEWVDYIAPQIYWHIGHEVADYRTLAEWWAKQVSGTDVKLYIGHSGYRSVDAEPGTVWYGGDEICRQIDLNRRIPEISGSIHFRIGSYIDTPELVSALKEKYTNTEEEPK